MCVWLWVCVLVRPRVQKRVWMMENEERRQHEVGRRMVMYLKHNSNESSVEFRRQDAVADAEARVAEKQLRCDEWKARILRSVMCTMDRESASSADVGYLINKAGVR